MHRPQLVLILCLLAIICVGVFEPASQESKSVAPASQTDERIVVPGLDWAALAGSTHDYMAARGAASDSDDLTRLLQNLETFHRAASQPGPRNSLDPKHFQDLCDGIRSWRRAGTNREDLLTASLMKAPQNPEAWGRLMRALGPGLLAGAHEFLLKQRPELIEKLSQVQAELAEAHGEAREKLQSDLEGIHDAITMCDRVPTPNASAREAWKSLQRSNRAKQDQEPQAATPSDD